MQPEPQAWLETDEGVKTPVRGTCSLGRTTVNDLVLDDEKVSRRHALINVQGQGEHWLVDLGSSNGTYLNGRRLTQPCRIANGDRISIARHQFIFRVNRASIDDPFERPVETTFDVRTESCWLLVADLENSTQFIQRMSRDEIPRLTGRWLATCKQLIEENQGAVNKFLGDGFLAYWLDGNGIALHVARTMNALRELQSQDGPRFRLALHFGDVSIGGASTLGEDSLLGSTVNFVFRMEQLASSLNVPCLISAAANEAFDSVLPTTSQGTHPIPSFEGEWDFFTT